MLNVFSQSLNPQQYEAVTTQSRYVRIIAGAGSGKTRVLTFRLAYLISEKQIAPEHILAITFTNKVAKEMLSRASQLVSASQGRLKIMTYHSFAARLLRQEIYRLGYPSSFTILDEDDQEKIIKSIAEDKGFRRGDEIVKQALRYISEQKSQGISPENIRITDERFPTEKLCLEFYHLYETKLKRLASLDFDDLLIKAILILEQFPEAQTHWQNKFRHILIDEFQDTNDVQYHLLRLLLTQETSLYVVGDPDQTIYTWRGANPTIILDLEKQYPIQTIILNENYRSTKPILDVANQLIDHNRYRVKKDLFTKVTGGDPVAFHQLASREEEAHWVIQAIQQRLFAGALPGEIAILYRANYLTLPLEKELTRRQIPFKIFGGQRFYQRQEIKDVIAYLKLLVNPKDDLAFERIINVPRRGIGEVTFAHLQAIAHAHQLSLFETALQMESLPELSPKLKSQLSPMVNVLKTYQVRLETVGLNLREEIEKMLEALGYLASLRKDDEEGRLENVQTLLDDIDDYLENQNTPGFAQYLEMITLMSAQDEYNTNDHVSLMTVHTAKGLEFSHVYVIGLNEGVFPSVRTLNDDAFHGLEEERRLCYVAMTRAKKTLTLTCASDYSFVIQGPLIPSRFFKEAGLQFAKHHLHTQPNDPPRTYSSARLGLMSSSNQSNVTSISSNPERIWAIGDLVDHESFGPGVVRSIISSEIIEVEFLQSKQLKKLIAQHPKLHKKQA